MTEHLSVDDETSFSDLKIISFWDGGLIVRVGSRSKMRLWVENLRFAVLLCALTAKNK